VNDFPDPQLGKAVQYGVYDIGADTGWASVGQDSHTAAVAVETIRRWWHAVGARAYPEAVPTVTGCGYGRPSRPGLPTRRAWKSPWRTCRQAPPSGTKSSTGCSRTSR
jgi:hypothetical protein